MLPCWLLNNLEFGGFEDTSSTLFVKLGPKGSPEGNATGSGDSSDDLRDKVLVLPIFLSMTVLVGLLSLLYHSVYRRRALKRALESPLIVSGAPINFSYCDLQCRTGNLHRSACTYTYIDFERDEIAWTKPIRLDQWGLMLSSLFFFHEGLGVDTRWDIGCSEEAWQASWEEGIHNWSEHYWLYASHEPGSTLRLLLRRLSPVCISFHCLIPITTNHIWILLILFGGQAYYIF